MSVSGPPAPPGGGGTTGPGRPDGAARPFQPWRAAAVVVVAIVVGVAVLSRMGGGHNTASATTSTAPNHGPRAPTTTTSVAPGTTVPPATTTTTLPPNTVTVLVLNGGTTLHGALYFVTELHGYGYDTLAPNNAASQSVKLSEILVNKSADRANALAIAQLLKTSPSAVMTPTATNDVAVPVADRQLADVIVVVGADIQTQVPNGYTGPTTSSVSATT